MEWFGLSSGLMANAGLPLVESGVWALVITAVIVSAFEAALLKRWYEVRPVVVKWTGQGSSAVGMDDEPERWTPSASLLVLAANLVSTLVGWFYFAHSRQALSWILGTKPLERAGVYIVCVCAVAFLISVVVEWPFFSKAIKDRPLSREGLFVCLGCNLLAGAVILVWFSLSGMSSLLTAAKIKPPVEIAQNCGATVYYVSSRQLWSVECNGFNPHSTRLAVPDGEHVAVMEASSGEAKVYALRKDGSVDRALLNLGTSFAAASAGEEGQARYFGPDEGRKFFVDYGRDAYDGLGVRTPDRIYKLALDSTPLSWRWSDVTVLPNNQAIAKVGPEVVLIDLESGEIGGLAQAESPTVAVGSVRR
jgi:hypothetical protein